MYRIASHVGKAMQEGLNPLDAQTSAGIAHLSTPCWTASFARKPMSPARTARLGVELKEAVEPPEPRDEKLVELVAVLERLSIVI